MVPKVIKNEEDYERALDRIGELMDAAPGTPEGDELELLATLLELYEEDAHPVDLPDPIDAVVFRMEQAGLKQKDLIPFIGSRGKVSEVLSRRRPLSLAMMRRLHQGLGIPAEVLLHDPEAHADLSDADLAWERFPLAEMVRRSWISFPGALSEAKRQAKELISSWAAPLGAEALCPTLLRQHVRAGGTADPYALDAWRMRVCLLALEQEVPAYRPGTVTQEFVRDLVRLSYLDKGPLLAREYLQKNGIRFVTESHLERTHLDGAAIRLPDGTPLVALTLRYDRLDHFWFTICHELAHIAIHFDGAEHVAFFDDLEQAGDDPTETEADRWAAEALIPEASWTTAHLGPRPTARQVVAFATALRISPAIPAGRIRRGTGNYKRLTPLVGHRQVRRLFLEP